MFGLELAVPVDLGVVELEDAVVLLDLDVHVVRSTKDFIAEGPELGLVADVVDFVDDGADFGVLVEDDLGDDLLVGEVPVPEVEMGWCGK